MDNHPPREVDDAEQTREATEAACMTTRVVGRLGTSVFPLSVSAWEEDDRTCVGVWGALVHRYPHSIHKKQATVKREKSA